MYILGSGKDNPVKIVNNLRGFVRKSLKNFQKFFGQQIKNLFKNLCTIFSGCI